MSVSTKDINFGEIDHFLYVRICSVCADLGLNFRGFIEQSYYPLVDLINEKGVTQFWVLQKEYKKYADYREKTRYAPRMIEKKHAIVVKGIHEAIHKHLVIIKDENNFPWIVILQILLMVMEVEMDKMDERSFKQGQKMEDRIIINEDFSDMRPNFDDESYRVEKTKKRRKYELRAQIYPERKSFRVLD